MLRQLMIAGLLASADALAPGASASRRAVLGQAAASGAGALLLAPALLAGSPPAVRAQELKQACHPHLALTPGRTPTRTSPLLTLSLALALALTSSLRKHRPPTPTCTALDPPSPQP